MSSMPVPRVGRPCGRFFALSDDVAFLSPSYDYDDYRQVQASTGKGNDTDLYVGEDKGSWWL